MQRAMVKHGGREAYVDGPARMTFAQWSRRSASLAAEFAVRGVRAGSVVALLVDSGLEYAIAYLAALRLGAVVTGLNPRLGTREVGAILAACEPDLVVKDARLTYAEGLSGTSVMDVADLSQAVAADRPLPNGVRQPGADEPAVIIWTSGTTGDPKGAWFDQAGLAAAVAAAGVVSRPGDRRLIATPFAHAGYMAKVWDQLVHGTTVVLCPRPWTATGMARTLIEEDIDVAAAVPTQWFKLLEVPGLERESVPRLRLAVSATAAASPDLVLGVRRLLGCPLVVRYATTESPSITGTDPDSPLAAQCTTVGRPQTGMHVRIVDRDRMPVPQGIIGEICVRGGCVMRGYWRDHARTRDAFDSGWLRTGDLGYFDEAGNLVLAGRGKEMYIRGGYNVYPLEVENVIATHPKVAQVAVVAADAHVIGEIGVVFIVPVRHDSVPELDEIRSHVAAALADYKAPDRLVVVDSLPTTAMLKVDKSALRTMAASTSGATEYLSGRKATS